MPRYYTRVCNFYYGSTSETLIKNKKALALHGNKKISFNEIEIISRSYRKKIPINRIYSLPNNLIKKVKLDLEKITKKKKIL